ncbi:MAG: glycoside hydrolase family 3 N-terminal domain-containing protein [Terriglobia bacterium]
MKTLVYFAAALALATAAPCYSQVKLTPEQQSWVDQTLAHMALDEKIGQVIFPVSSGVFTNVGSDEFRKIQENIQKYHVGGYHIEGYSGGNPISGAYLISRMQQLAQVPLLITADFEGGAGYQFAGATRFPRGMAIGATGKVQYAYDAATFTAREAKAMGVNVNFYPVVDVNNNPQNPIINIRSFGENPTSVGEFAQAYVKGTQESGILATAKHFPGHGDTSVDSHLELPVINFDRARLNLIELPPFEAAIKAGVDSVMTAHIYLPQFEKAPGLPASLSPAITTNLLRHDLGFQGLVFTDALVMHAISANFGADQAALRAIEAGADVALEPADIPGAFAALQAAVAKGDLKVERLDQSVRRLLSAKAWEGLNVQRAPDLNQVDTLVGTRAAEQKSDEIMEHALTLVKDERHAIPLLIDPGDQALLLNFVDTDNPEFSSAPGLTFRAEFMKRHPRTLFAQVGPMVNRNEADLIRQLAGVTRALVVSCSIRIASYKGSMGLSEPQQDLLRSIAHHDGPFVFALFGSPYLLNYIPELPSYALAFEFYPGAEAAMVRALFGEIPFQGKLPVTVGTFPVGFNLKK